MSDDWERRTLGEVAVFENGYPFKPADLNGFGLPVLRIKQLIDPTADMDRSDTAVPKRFQIDDGDLIFSWSATLASRIWDRGPALLNQHLFKVSARKGSSLGWLHLVLDDAVEALLSKSHGTTMKHVTKRVLEAHEVRRPPVSVQLRIVDLISAVDDHITRLRAESTALSAAAGARRALFPQAEEVPLGAVLQGIDSGRSLGLNGSDEHATMRVLMLSAVRPAVFHPGEVKPLPADASMPDGALVHEGDLLITRSNTPERVGYACRARTVQAGTFLPDLIWRLRLTPSCDADYLEQALASPLMRARVSGSAGGTSQSMRKINKAGLRTLLVPLPSLDEQRSYAIECSALAGQSQAVAREADGLTVFRRQLLRCLLSREVEVPDEYDRLLDVGVA